MIKFLIPLSATLSILLANSNIISNEEYISELNKSATKLQYKLPFKVDNMTKLISVNSRGLSLSYTYSLDYDKSGNQSRTIDESMWPKSRKEFEENLSSSQKIFNTATSCTNSFLKTLLYRGGKINYIYYWKDTNEKFSSTVFKKDCIELDKATEKEIANNETLVSALEMSINLYEKILPKIDPRG